MMQIVDINYTIAIENDIDPRDWAKILRLYTDSQLALLDLDLYRSRLSINKDFLEAADREKLNRAIEDILVE